MGRPSGWARRRGSDAAPSAPHCSATPTQRRRASAQSTSVIFVGSTLLYVIITRLQQKLWSKLLLLPPPVKLSLRQRPFYAAEKTRLSNSYVQ
uniref:Uncharacterized protein n=1 Tax=Ascaris lumbricoides TaxID=6252 RepID=A0A0M3IJR3_ASCLU